MVMVVLLGVVLLGTAFVLAWVAVGRNEAETGGITRSLAMIEAMGNAPDELKGDVDRSFSDRVLNPLYDRASGFSKRLTGGDASVRIQRKLNLAGAPEGWTVDRVASSKVVGAVSGLVIAFLYSLILGLGFTVLLVVAAAGGIVGFYAVDLWLYQRAYNRAERIQAELADAIDLLTISVESGLGFDAALQQVARNTDGPISEEFARVLREMQLGIGRTDALRNMGDRSKVPDLKSFVGALAQADVFGVPIGQVLRTQSVEMRVKRRQYAEKKAQQVPVKITVPLIFCILPCLFVVVIGPAAISIVGSNFGGG